MRREAWRNFATATLFSPKYNPHAATANQQASTALVSPPKVKSWVCSQVAASQDKSGCWRRCCKAFRAGIPFSNTLVTWCNLLFSSQGLTEILFIHSWPTGLIQPIILTYTCLWPLLHCFCLDEQNTSLCTLPSLSSSSVLDQGRDTNLVPRVRACSSRCLESLIVQITSYRAEGALHSLSDSGRPLELQGVTRPEAVKWTCLIWRNPPVDFTEMPVG